MYERFFGFEEAPFRLTPDPRYLFLSAKHKEALGHLQYGLEEGAGFVAITGEIGAGKTTLVRSFLSDPPANVRYAYILNPVLSGVELLQEINHEFGLSEEGTQRDLLGALNTFLLQQKKAGNQVVLVIDEAQALGGAILEQLRMLSNFETESAKLLQIVLVGQPELRDLLARPDLEQLEQRITVRWHLGALDRSETTQYVSHRLSTASESRARRIFTSGAMKRVYAYTQGVPRRINVLCHRALLVAYARDSTSITRSIVSRAIEEIETPRRRESLGGGGLRVPAWVKMAAGLVLAAAVGGLGTWGFTRLSGGDFPVVARLAADTTPDPVEVVRALDFVDREPEPLQPVSPTGPRVAPYPLTMPVDGWPTDPPPVVAAPRPVAEVAPSFEPEVAPRESAPVLVPVEPVAALDPAPADRRWVERAELGEALRQTTPSESAYEAVQALVGVWQADPLTAGEAASQALDLPTIAAGRGLDYLEFSGNLNVLRVLDLPAILELDLGDGGGVHFALVDQIDDDRARVRVGRGMLEVSHGALSEVWFGQGHLLWYDLDDLGQLLARGASGASVRRLHELLRGAGVYRGPGGAVFDGVTEEAVVQFQRAVHLEADGKVGPMTMIALYGLAAPDRVPHLGTPTSTSASAPSPVSVAASGAGH